MDIVRLDPADPAATRAWHATYREAHVFGQDHPAAWLLEEMEAEFLGQRPGRDLEAYAGYVDGEPVVTGVVKVPLLDNLDTVQLEVGTRPRDRRRGHGSAMLAHLVDRAVALGRRTLQADAAWPYDGPADGAGTPDADFLTGRGFAFCLGDVKRVLELPVDEALLDRLVQEAAPHHQDYTLRQFVGRVPEDLVDVFGGLVGSLMTEAPQGGMDLEEEIVDATRIRADEHVLELSRRTKYTTVATAPDGELVAYSELVVPGHDPDPVYQWGTLVRPAHRGHRLGMATKVHNLRQLQAREPSRRFVLTWNAEVNSHMIAVNEALGFRPVGRLGEFQRRL